MTLILLTALVTRLPAHTMPARAMRATTTGLRRFHARAMADLHGQDIVDFYPE